MRFIAGLGLMRPIVHVQIPANVQNDQAQGENGYDDYFQQRHISSLRG
jgi:hypothetical protein